MPPMNLPRVTFLGRWIKPVAFGFMLACLVLTWEGFTSDGVLDGSVWNKVMGVGALIIAGLLNVAWWKKSQYWSEVGLQCVFYLLVFRGCAIGLDSGNWDEVALSLAYAVIAGGAYILEKADPEAPQRWEA